MPVPVYTATVSRQGRWWIISVPELELITQARTVREIEEMTRGVISAVEDRDADSFDVSITLTLPSSVEESWRESQHLRNQAEKDSARAALLARDVARRLVTEEHLSQRDAAAVLGLSQQRVHQLITNPTAPAPS